MKSKSGLSLLFFTFFALYAYGQNKALTFEEAEKAGISMQHLDGLYKSAVHDNEKLAVFKTADEQAKLQNAYKKLLQALGKFLQENNFKWAHPTKGFNRIYISPDGHIDYFLYHFPEEQITAANQNEFSRLLNLFVYDYKFTLAAKEKFAQCSPVIYTDM